MIGHSSQNTGATPAVLLAGGAGFIGSHTAKLLVQSGFQPIVLDNLCTGNRFALKYGPFHEGSIGDARLVRQICDHHKPICAILLAGHAYIGESSNNPRKYFRNNVAETISFLDALIDAEVKNIVFSSSCSVYGLQNHMPITEDSPTNPLSPYAESKLFIEKALHWYNSACETRHVCLRYFNAAGADPEGELGEHHDPETHLIPLAIRAAMGAQPLQVFGADYPTPDGTAIRDFIHVSDLAEAHLRAVNHLAANGKPLTLNLGTGIGYSVKQVISAVEREAKAHVPVEYAPRRPGDAPVLVANPANAERQWGWTPRHSSLATIVRTAWNWHSQRNLRKAVA